MLKIYNRLKYIIFLPAFGLLWAGCSIINPHEQVPTYIHIDSFQFKSTFSGITNTHKINTVWVLYNGSYVGIFDLPCTFPVIASGTGKLMIGAGVAVNGQNNFNGVYPFYEIDTSFSFAAQPGKVLTYEPTTRFYSATKIIPVSDFDGALGFALAYGNVPITKVKDDSAGNVGVIDMVAAGDTSIDSSTQMYNLPTNTAAFLEFDYKSTVPFYVGMQASTGGAFFPITYLTGINPSDHWQKFYVNLRKLIGLYPGGDYTIYIKTELPDGAPNGKVLLDNIQLVTF